MGYFVVFLTIILLIYFIIRKIRQLKRLGNSERRVYCLFAEKISVAETENFSRYYGVFQIAEEEIRLEIPYQLYLQHQQPERGLLIYRDQQFIAFEK